MTNKKYAKSNKGITLVALVVTVVVLLILAGITLTYVLGDKGIINLAKDAKKQTEEATQKEQDDIGNLVNMVKEEIGGVNRVDVSTVTKKVDKNTPAKDSLGNPITIPAGFKVVLDGEDEEGNQFVWIPVGDIKNKSGDSNGPTTC